MQATRVVVARSNRNAARAVGARGRCWCRDAAEPTVRIDNQ